MELFSQPNDLPVHVLDILHGIDRTDLIAIDHKCIISQRLNLQIIIEIHDLRNGLIGFSIQECLIKLPGLAGTAHDQSFPVLV